MNPQPNHRPDLCPDCHALGVIATRTGPTCTHKPVHGAAWFPAWWGDKSFDDAGERRRTEHLQSINLT